MTSGGTQRSIARRGLALLAITALALAALLASGATAQPAFAGSCANADATIDEASGEELRKALACVINNKRANQDRKKVDQNGKLETAAERHNKTMLDEDCWAHRCDDEPGLEKRIRRTGYFEGAREWKFAENFGCALTPKGMVNAWLDSNFQRRNLLNPGYEDLGVAAAKDLVSNPPSGCEGDRVTYTVVLAGRKG
jgi:uncharacterized protein YkwD